MREQVIIGRVGMSVLLFKAQVKSDANQPGFLVAENTKIYSLSNLLCFIRTAPGAVHKASKSGSYMVEATKKVQQLAKQANFSVDWPFSQDSLYLNPCASVVVEELDFFKDVASLVDWLPGSELNEVAEEYFRGNKTKDKNLYVGHYNDREYKYAAIGEKKKDKDSGKRFTRYMDVVTELQKL